MLYIDLDDDDVHVILFFDDDKCCLGLHISNWLIKGFLELLIKNEYKWLFNAKSKVSNITSCSYKHSQTTPFNYLMKGLLGLLINDHLGIIKINDSRVRFFTELCN